MAYYVLGDQGQKYGPADVLTLNQWIGEGRIVAHTMLEDEFSGGQIVASAVPGLQFPMAPPPMASNYPRYGQAPQMQAQPYMMSAPNAGASAFKLALGLGLVSPILSFMLPIGGLFTCLWGIRQAVRAKELGHPLAVLAIVINALAIIFWLFTRRSLFLH